MEVTITPDLEQEFNQYVKENNLEVLSWKVIAKMLFMQKKEQDKQYTMLIEMAKNIEVTEYNQETWLYEDKSLFDKWSNQWT